MFIARDTYVFSPGTDAPPHAPGVKYEHNVHDATGSYLRYDSSPNYFACQIEQDKILVKGLGFMFFWSRDLAGSIKMRSIAFELPWLGVMLLASLPPGAWIYRKRQRAKRPPFAECRTCGYSLIGNTSGVCPECGTAAASAQ